MISPYRENQLARVADMTLTRVKSRLTKGVLSKLAATALGGAKRRVKAEFRGAVVAG
jgi:hypothetical protein